MERVAIFIDGSNFYHGLKSNIGNTSIDFAKLGEVLCRGRRLVRTYYYNAPVDQTREPERYRSQQRFFERLKRTPYLSLKLGRLERRGDTFVEKGVDINIAVDMLRYAYEDTYDTAILISGDGDFAVAVEAVEDRGKHVENAYFPNVSRHLQDACDVFIKLDPTFLAPALL